MQQKSVAVRTTADLAPSKLLTLEDVKAIAEVLKPVEELVMTVLEPGIDWGIHPGTTSFALKDPGAAKILTAFRCYSDPEVIRYVADNHQISFLIKTKLIDRVTGQVMGTGVASCSTTETKYRYRWLSAEDLEREGINKEGLKIRKPKHKGGEPLYRAANPEFEELENTVFKMACKRAEVDGAQGLPGVGTALGKLFGHPVERTYRWFWPLAKRLGFPDEYSVHKALSVASMKDWLAQGKKLDEAIEVLISMPAAEPITPEPAPETTGPTELDPEAPLRRQVSLEAPTDHRTIAWRSVKILLKELRPSGDTVAKWFQTHCSIPVNPNLSEFGSDLPADKFSLESLSGFHNELLAFKKERQPGGR